ncbi:PQQ-binding-like beta-propeller repeat protein [Streptomyces sp. NK08204]|uniref:outer membrane protein assembly factor BamB family protein n=1 Tax=Streptomyces sp. NK08204 TaxID=2873260 RepID=UPI001CEC53F0|nr:PQQ-binding-like beta-propeller repeat protein [Streptomyces sp. NK08204]
MTQPPPPPNQPPQQGGFGPPQDQAPQPPQPQPGYGYPQTHQPPQAPPAPPAQAPQPPQPGYGYPGAQQNPYAPQPPAYGQPPTAPMQPQPGYGQPVQPAYGQPTQPGYGQPAQPGYGYPGQPPTVPMQPQQGQSGGGRSNSTVIIVVAAVVAIVLIVVAGIWYSSSSGGDDKKHETAGSTGGTGGTGGKDDKGGSGGTGGGKEKVPANTAADVLFQVPMPKTDDTVVTSGSWLTDKVYAKSGIAEIVGYDPAKGTKLWTSKLPGPVCAASEHVTTDNRTAIVFQPKMPAKDSSAGCSKVGAIDLDTGKLLWSKSVNSGDSPITWDNVTVAQHTAAVGSTYGGAAFDMDSGKLLWQPKPDDTCYDAGYGGGAKLVAVRKCGEYDNRQLHIQNIDPKTGKVISEYKMTRGIEYASIVSTDPLVVAADVGDSAGDGSGVSDYFSIDAKTGKLLTRISAPGDTYAGHCDGITRMEDCRQIVAGNGKLYLSTEDHDGTGDYSETNEIIAFDLTTGKQTGQRAEAGDGYSLSPLRMDGPNLIAYKRPPYDKGGQIVSIDGGSFKVTKLLENPAQESVRDVETSMLPEYSEILYTQGRLYMSAAYAHKSDGPDEKEYLVAAFGTSG